MRTFPRLIIFKSLLKVVVGLSVALLCCTIAFAENDYYQSAMRKIREPWQGDLDGMIERRAIRILVTFNKTNFFLDSLTTRGITYDALMQFESFLNEELKRKHLKIHVITIPVTRDKIIPYLQQGLGDIAAANLTITPDRLAKVDFSDPFYSQVKELIVTSPSTCMIAELSKLSGKAVAVRKSSRYYQSLLKYNMELMKSNKSPIDIHLIENNIHTGVKYLDFIYHRYFNHAGIEEIDKILLTFAAYNAGPAKVKSLRKKTATMGLNPNI